jgi:hypothetical protein
VRGATRRDALRYRSRRQAAFLRANFVIVSGIKFPRQAATKLLEDIGKGAWSDLPAQDRMDPDGAAARRRNLELIEPLPTRRHLAEILDVAYVASLMEEEGRRVTFTMAYLSEEGARHHQHQVFPFKTPLPFVPSALAKYALAAPPLTTSFGVWPDARGRLAIWGIAHHGNHTFDVDLTHPPPYLSLRVRRAGAFTARFESRLRLLFSRDDFHIRDPEAGVDLVSMLRDVLGVAVAVALERLALRMVALGHGGTILMTRAAPQAVSLHGVLTMRDGGLSLLKDAVEVNRKRGTGEEAPEQREGTAVHLRFTQDEQHREALDHVAQLTAVDGAVLMDTDLNVLGFGATIKTEGDLPSATCESPRKPGKRTPWNFDKRGNRHRSAIYFCAQQPDLAIALIASQDGDFSIAVREGIGKVHVIGPYELGFGIESWPR